MVFTGLSSSTSDSNPTPTQKAVHFEDGFIVKHEITSEHQLKAKSLIQIYLFIFFQRRKKKNRNMRI